MSLKKDIIVGNSKPHRDRGNVGSGRFWRYELALAPRHLRDTGFAESDS